MPISLLQAFSKQSDHIGNETDHFHEDREHHTESHSHSHSDSVWYGLMALLGMVGFLVFERLIMILRDLALKHSHNDTNVSSASLNIGRVSRVRAIERYPFERRAICHLLIAFHCLQCRTVFISGAK